MKLVIIESPYKGDVSRNKRYLQACIRDCIKRGESPYASHQMLTDALDDNDPEQRKIGISAGLAWRKALYISNTGLRRVTPVFYFDLGWSDGMTHARKMYLEENVFFELRKLEEEDSFFDLPTCYCGNGD